MNRVSTILVPVDFSTHALQALETAIDLAKTFKAKLHLLHCCQLDVGVASAYGLMVPATFDRQIREAAARRLAEWRDKAAKADIEVTTEILSVPPTAAIASAAERIGADLIVIGTRGLSGIKHVMVGSVAERTVRNARCPVLTVKAKDET